MLTQPSARETCRPFIEIAPCGATVALKRKSAIRAAADLRVGNSPGVVRRCFEWVSDRTNLCTLARHGSRLPSQPNQSESHAGCRFRQTSRAHLPTKFGNGTA